MSEPSDHVLRQFRDLRRFLAEKFAGIDRHFVEVNGRLDSMNNEIRQVKVEVSSLRVAVGQDVAMIEDHEDRLKALEK